MIRSLLTALMLAALCCGCGKDEDVPPADPYNKPFSRMEDPDYRKALKEREESRRDLMRREAALMRELEKAKAEDPASPRVKELEEKQKLLAAEHIRQREATRQIIAERIKREQKAIEQKQADDLNKKGN